MGQIRGPGIPAPPASEELRAQVRALEVVEARADPTTKTILEALQQLRLRFAENR